MNPIINHTLKMMLKLIFFIFTLLPFYTFAQNSLADSSLNFNKLEFTISYDIVVKGNNIEGLAETYNGGIQTIFVKKDMVRIRLVSLMRIQSIFFNGSAMPNKPVAAVIKESGKDRTKMLLFEKQWLNYNKVVDNTACDTSYSDTLTILNFLCKKAVIKQKDKGRLDIFYVPGISSSVLSQAIPLFSCVPGMVLKYTYTLGSKVIEYSASAFNDKKLAPAIFIIPSQGYKLKKYVGSSTTK